MCVTFHEVYLLYFMWTGSKGAITSTMCQDGSNKTVVAWVIYYVCISSGCNVAIGTADISAGDMLIFSVSVIGTDGQRSRYKCQYSAYKINFYLTHAKECIATKSC